MQPRKTRPTKKLGYGNTNLQFRVWTHDPSYQEDPKPWKCSACFQYLLEALDYIAYCQDRGSDVVFQSPADCKLVRASDRRAVSKDG